jgi:hypothetical protein
MFRVSEPRIIQSYDLENGVPAKTRLIDRLVHLEAVDWSGAISRLFPHLLASKSPAGSRVKEQAWRWGEQLCVQTLASPHKADLGSASTGPGTIAESKPDGAYKPSR